MCVIFCYSEEGDIDVVELGSKSCVTRFIKKMLSIVCIFGKVLFICGRYHSSRSSDWRPGGRGFNPRRGWQHSFVEIDREIF